MTVRITTFLCPILLLVNYSPHACRTQLPPGVPVIMETRNLLAMTQDKLRSANIDGKMAQEKIEEIRAELRRNATTIHEEINRSINETLNDFLKRIDGLVENDIDVVAKDCAVESSSVKSAALRILAKTDSCVINTVESIDEQFNETHTSIESALARINSYERIAETCLAGCDSNQMGFVDAIVNAICVNKVKEAILSTIKEEISPWNDAAKITILTNDALDQMMNCAEEGDASSFIADTELIYVKIKTCIADSKFVKSQS